MNTEIVVTNDIININVTDQIVIIEAPSGAYPLPSGVYSVYGRTGNVVAQEGDYNLTLLGDVTISTPSTGQVLRYNGTTWVNSTESYVGTVTSVAATVPTGLTISGSPITSAGTLAFGYASGYSIPTNASQTTWDTAYSRSLTSAAVTGTTTKTLTLNQQGGGTITASWSDLNTDAVTSVFGRTGAVVATSGDYSTTLVTEGTNLYYTDARARASNSFVAGSGAYNSTTGVITIPTNNNQITNGSNFIILASLSATTPLSYNSSTGAFSISQSNTTTNGYLSFTDWNTFNGKQAALNGTGFVKASGTTISYDNSTYLTTISGITAGGELSGTYANPSLVNSAVTGKVLTGVNITGGTVVDTDSILTAFGKVQNQINGLIGGSIYKGTWNASTNTPTLTSSVGTSGNYYIVSVAGSTNLNGITDWQVGDWAIFQGSVWQKVDNTDSVVSVNGFTGAVSLTTSNISEGSNLYYTNARTIASSLTGYTSGAGTITASDTILTAIQKLNGNIGSLTTGVSSVFGRTGAVVSATGDYTTSQVTEGSNLYFTNLRAQSAITLTTTGTSGDATYSSGVLNIPNYGSALSSYVPYTGATADLNLGSRNLYVNNIFDGFSSITASGTQVVLTVSSVPSYYVSGSGGQTIKLPDATTLQNGAVYVFNNNQSSGAITVNNNSNTLVVSIPSGGYCTLELNDNSIAAGSWDRHFLAPSNVSWSTNTFDYAGSITSATWNGSTIAINRGGTGATTAGAALTNLGGQPLATNLTSLAGLSYASTSFVKMTASGTFALDTNTYQTALTNPITGTGTSGQIGYFNGTTSITSDATFTYSPTAQHLINNSVTAASAIARGTNLTPTLIASANSDVLVGLDINPTFTLGAFTGTTSAALRVGGEIITTANNTYNIGNSTNNFNTVWASTFRSTGNVSLLSGGGTTISSATINIVGLTNGIIFKGASSTLNAQVFSNGNWLLQQGGTFTDAGYKLDVAGTTRLNGLQTFVGTTASDGGQLGSELAAVTGTGTNWTLAGTNLNVGGYTHTTGSTTALTTSLAAVNGNSYQIVYTITGRTAGTINISFGGQTSGTQSVSGTVYIKASSTSVLIITPTTDFDGNVIISLKQVTAGSATTTFQNSSGTANIEVRASGVSNTNTFIGLNSGRYNVTGGTQNTSLGSGALASILSANNNTAIGYNAGTLITTGGGNTLIGVNAGQSITTGVNNTFIGSSAGTSNTSGGNNVAIGSSVLSSMTTGTRNVAIAGDSVMSSLTSGSDNIAIGRAALFNITTSSSNIALGTNAGRFIANGSTVATVVDNSIFLGTNSYPQANSQTNQIVIGYQTTGLGSNTTIIGNSSTTTAAIYGNLLLGTTTDSGYKLDVSGTGRFTGALTSSSSVQADGSSVGFLINQNGGAAGLATYSANTDRAQIAFKYAQNFPSSNNYTRVLDLVATGDATGGGAIRFLTSVNNATPATTMYLSPSGNVGIGTSNPSTTLDVNGSTTITGAGNTLTLAKSNNYPALAWQGSTYTNLIESGDGYMAFTQSGAERMRITSGGNVGIGNIGASDQRLSLSGVDNTSSNYALVVKNSSLSTILYVRNDGQCYISGLTWVYGSDRRLKENINYIETGLDKILALKPAKFDYIDGAKNNIGWIAQDVEEIIPEAISINTINDKGHLGLKSDFIVPYLVKAIQEQQALITLLQARLDKAGL